MVFCTNRTHCEWGKSGKCGVSSAAVSSLVFDGLNVSGSIDGAGGGASPVINIGKVMRKVGKLKAKCGILFFDDKVRCGNRDDCAWNDDANGCEASYSALASLMSGESSDSADQSKGSSSGNSGVIAAVLFAVLVVGGALAGVVYVKFGSGRASSSAAYEAHPATFVNPLVGAEPHAAFEC
jgi:hypothetical protein